MDRHFMILKNTGEIKGYYIEGIWDYENILKEVGEGEFLKEITKDLWNELIGNGASKICCPKIKGDKINELVEFNTLSKVDLAAFFTEFIEEIEFEVIPHEPTQQEKDIKALAEILNGIVVQADASNNPIADKIQDILNRY